MGSPTLRIARLALYFTWTLSLMPVQLAGLALRLPMGARRLPMLLSPLVLPNARLSGPADRKADRRAPGAVRGEPHLLHRHHGPRFAYPGSFIAKAEVAKWPFFGWLAKLQRTVFVDRQVRSTALQRDAIADRLAAGDALILFAEGTSGDGNRVLPFKTRVVRRCAGKKRSARRRRAAGFARLYAARRHPDRAALPPVFRMVRRDRSGASYVGHGRPRHRRSGGRISSARLPLRLRVAQGARRLLSCADRRRDGRRALRSAAADAGAAETLPARRCRPPSRRREPDDPNGIAQEAGARRGRSVFLSRHMAAK